MSTELLKLIKKPLVTEKNATLMAEHNQYAFEVDYDANRPQIKRAIEKPAETLTQNKEEENANKKDNLDAIKRAIEKIFNVKVERVRTMIVRGKTKTYRSKKNKRPNWKKAYVTLQEGSKIEIFQGV